MEAELVDALNTAKTTPTKESCLDQLARVSELLFERDRTFALLDRFCADVIETFQRHRNQDVREKVVVFMKKAATAGAEGLVGKVRAEVVPPVIRALIYLVQDSAAKVARRAVAVATGVVRRALRMVFAAPLPPSQAMADTWTQLQEFVRLAPVLVGTAPADVRLAAIKLVETLVLSLSFPNTNALQRNVRHGRATLGPDFVTLRHLPPSSAGRGGHPFLARVAIEDQGRDLHAVLAELVSTAHAAPATARAKPVKLPAKALIIAVNGLALTATHRPQFAAASVAAFSQLDARLAGGTGATWLSAGHSKGVRQTVRTQLLKLLKMQHAWVSRDAITALLASLGAPSRVVASSLEQCRKAQRDSSKRARSGEGDRASKRAASASAQQHPLIEFRQLEAIPEAMKDSVLVDLVIANMANLGKQPSGGSSGSSTKAQSVFTALTTLLSGLGGGGEGGGRGASGAGGDALGARGMAALGRGGALQPVAVRAVAMTAEAVSRQHLRAFERMLATHARSAPRAAGGTAGDMVGVLTRIAVESGVASSNAYRPPAPTVESAGAADSILRPVMRPLEIPMHVVAFADHCVEDIAVRLELAVALLHGFFAASVVQARLRAIAGTASDVKRTRAYDYIFERVLLKLRERFFAGDSSAVRGIDSIFRRAPALPLGVVDTLFSLCTTEPPLERVHGVAAKARAEQAQSDERVRRVQAVLPIVQSVIEQRPTAREHCIAALLRYTLHPSVELSQRCVRILAAKDGLHGDQRFGATIEGFARAQLGAMPRRVCAVGDAKEGAGVASAGAAPGATVLGAQSAAAAATATPLGEHEVAQRIALFAALTNRSSAAQRAPLLRELLTVYGASSDAVRAEFHRVSPASGAWFEGSVCKLVKSLARGVDGPASVVALLCVDGTTGDSDMLVVHALRWAVEGGSSAKAHPGGASGAAAAGSGAARVVLSAGFVDAVRALYTSSPTANFGLIQPVLPALTRAELERALPTLVMHVKEEPNMVADAFKRIVRFVDAASGAVPTPADELFVLLHALHGGVGKPCPSLLESDAPLRSPAEEQVLKLEYVLLAIELCLRRNFGMRETFTRVALVTALNRLASVPPPATSTLVMRTILLTLEAGMPAKLVVKLLESFVAGCAVGGWSRCDSNIWNGFLRCVYTTTPDCFPVVVALPAEQLNLALAFDVVSAEERVALKEGLTKWASEELQCKRRVPDAAKAVLGL